ncbi:hypothetical protein L7F22_049952 [Adiantum nelumboides]|nr:hypothetical protein [Adiantum nelumboides]
MTRIRKRPSTATASSVTPELLATSNGCPSAGAQFSRSLQDPRQALLCRPSWVKEDHLLLPAAANCKGHGGITSLSSAKEAKKQQLLAATPAVLDYDKPYIVAPSGHKRRGDDEGLGAKNSMVVGEAAKQDRDVEAPRNGAGKQIMNLQGDETCVASKGVAKGSGLAENRSLYAGGGERSEAACHERAIKVGSEQVTGTQLRHADPTDTDDGASEQPRKILPLHLILNSEPRQAATAATTRARPTSNELLCSDYSMSMPCNSSTSISCTTPRLTSKPRCAAETSVGGGRAEQKVPPLHKPRLLKSTEAGDSETSDVKTQGGSKSMRAEDERGNSDQSLDWPVSSWQGHRRARSSVLPSGRLANEVPALLDARASGVNGDGQISSSRIIKAETKVKVYPSEKKACCTPSPKEKPLPNKKVSSPHRRTVTANSSDASKKRKLDDHAAAAAADVDNGAALNSAPAQSSHHVLNQADSMRCRRKDGRRWQCKAQVVKPGAPFCHYHTLKMREKHATSVARRLAKRMQMQIKRNGEQLAVAGRARPAADISTKRPKLARSSVLQHRHEGGSSGLQGRVAREQEEEEDEEEEQDGDDDDDDDDEEFKEEESSEGGSDQQQRHVQGLSKSRWRKKCKPCIRRLLDIQDRARPAATDGLDCAASSPVWVVQPASPVVSSSSLQRSRPPASPLPECHLNTDPYEWRSDFP